jgi:rhodanese-related sulfurtransferase
MTRAYPVGFEEIDVQTFAQRWADTEASLQLIDVREPQEVAIAKLPDFIHLPLSQYHQWADTIHAHLDPTAETIVMCHHGIRSAQMCQWLRQQGFENVKNLAGGIDAYSVLIDHQICRY